MKISYKHTINHGAKGTCTFTYDTETKKATANFKKTSGYFAFYDFAFYIFFGVMKKDSEGKSKFSKKTSVKIGGLHGTGNNIWYDKNCSKTNVKYGTNTHVAFGYYCSKYRDGPNGAQGRCSKKWDMGPTVATKAFSLVQETVVPDLELNEADALHPTDFDGVSKHTNKIVVKWSLPSGSTPAASLAATITDEDTGAIVETLYSTSNPQTFANGARSGTLTFDSGLDVFNNYEVEIAVASSTEKLVDKWNDDSTLKSFRTREPNPVITLSNPVGLSDKSGATVYFTSKYGNMNIALSSMHVYVYDNTAAADIATIAVGEIGGYNGTFQGTITIPFTLREGHTYTIEPISATTYEDGVGMARGVSTSFTVNTVPPAPEITTITNSGNNLIFGEPDGSPRIDIGISGSNRWAITLKAGVSGLSNGVVINPLFSVAGIIGTNYCGLNDTALDAIYRTINTNSQTTIYVSLEYTLTDGNASGVVSKSAVMTLLGNAKTVKIGAGGATRRAKCWIGAGGATRRAVAWVGVGGTPRRSL